MVVVNAGMYVVAFVIVLLGLAALIAAYFRPLPWIIVAGLLLVLGFILQLAIGSGTVIHL